MLRPLYLKMNDWQLVSAYANGNEEAFEDLLKKYFRIVYSTAVRQVGDPHLAEEVAQSVFIIFSRKARGLRPQVSLTGWFLRTARFVSRDALKKVHRRAQNEQATGTLLEMQGTSPPDASNVAALVDEAFLSLSPAEQECIAARFFEEKSFREVAQLQMISEDAAQKRVSRGIEKMKAFLQRRDVKVSVVALPAMFAAESVRAAAGTQLVQSAMEAVQAAAHGKAVGGSSLLLADKAGDALAWRELVGAGTKILLGALLAGGSGFLYWANRKPALPANPAFQITDARVDVLGKAWSQVVLRVARLRQEFPRAPAGGDPRFGVYQRDYGLIVNETVRISGELDGLLQPGSDRTLMAEFLTIELREVLGLSEEQKAAAYALLRDQLAKDDSLLDALESLVQAKETLAATLREQLSFFQKRRFDAAYGVDGMGFLSFVVAAARDK